MVNNDNKKETSDAQCNCSPLTDQCPFLNPDQPHFQVTPSNLYAGHDVLWCGIPLRSV